MFGTKPGEERFQGKLNQFVITKLTGDSKNYWVIHTKGEEAISILISAMALMKMDTEQMIDAVKNLQVHLLSQMEWIAMKVQQESGLVVYGWGTKEKINLHDVVNKGISSSRVIGYELHEELTL